MADQRQKKRHMEVMCLSCASQCMVEVYQNEKGDLDTRGGCPRGEKYALGKARREWGTESVFH